jgi:hypothetical protein
VPWGLGALGLIVVVLGGMLAAHLRGLARACASMIKNNKPIGVDYSKSFFATRCSFGSSAPCSPSSALGSS